MEFKGTKGKWEYKITKKGHARISGLHWDNFVKIYTATDGVVDKKEETKANALLISKAPEMLEMLKRIEQILTYETIEPNSPIQLEIFELIKEATEII